mgnify:CR=1 FL=1
MVGSRGLAVRLSFRRASPPGTFVGVPLAAEMAMHDDDASATGDARLGDRPRCISRPRRVWRSETPTIRLCQDVDVVELLAQDGLAVEP